MNDGSLTSEQRFPFGENWRRFLELVDEERIVSAERSLATTLGVADLRGSTFVDVGSGSGLFSLAARRLGARVHSFDFDRDAVECALELKKRFRPNDAEWSIEWGSVLDSSYVKGLGEFDVTYSWGVLHHTGDMWRALENVACLVAPSGVLFISIYNDQGGASRRWCAVKRFYNKSGRVGRGALLAATTLLFASRSVGARLLRGEMPMSPRQLANQKRQEERGMSIWYDLRDWVGGYPFEVAKPEHIFEFYRDRGFSLANLKTVGGGHGCNEFVFTREPGDRNRGGSTIAGGL